MLNFAHGETGALAAAVLAKLVLDVDVPWIVALPLALGIGALIAVGIEAGVIRRLAGRPRVVSLVATIGVAQLLLVGRAILPEIEQVSAFPTPLDRGLRLAGVLLRSEHFLALAFIPAAVLGLTLFLSRTPSGVAIRASADNPEAAALAGMSPRRVSAIVWALAGALAALTVVLVAPMQGQQVGTLDSTALGAGLLLRALAAALVGRLTSVPVALLGGVGLGAGEALLLSRGWSPAGVEAVLFVVVLFLVLTRGETGAYAGPSEGRFAFSPAPPPVPPAAAGRWWVRRLGWLTAAGAAGAALLAPLVAPSSGSVFLLTRMVAFGVIGVSVVVLTGWAGQVSLGQFALAGVGAFTTAALVERGVGFVPALVQGALAGALVATVIGLPALRVRGLFLTITTLAFAVVARESIFTSALFTGSTGDASAPPGTVFGVDLGAGRTYYLFCLAILIAVAAAAARLRRTGAGRLLIAVRDNEIRAASFGVVAWSTRLGAFALSGGLAALGGGLLAGAAITFGPQDFRVEESFQVLAMVVIGGLGSVGGALAGAVYLLGVPALFGNTAVAVLLTSGLGLLVLLLYLPGGLASAGVALRGALATAVAGRSDQPDGAPRAPAPTPPTRDPAPAEETFDGPQPLLAADGIEVAFGGRIALDRVELRLQPGEILGLIGSNGAGKSTLLGVLAGDVAHQGGTVHFGGIDVTSLPAAARARLGLGRVLQDAQLFPELTVMESVLVACESFERSELVPAVLGLPPDRRAERARRSRAREVVQQLGLSQYADRQISDLSTGTRRVVELACLMAQRPRVLLLDEPTAGLAQREAEAFGPLLVETVRDLGAAAVFVEHDLPLVLSVSDRVQCLAAGSTIAVGDPEEVAADPEVLRSFLGEDPRAVARSG